MSIDYDLFMASIAYNKIADLSATTVALCLSAITELSNRYQWSRNNEDLNDTEWEEIQSIVELASEEIMSSLVGMIVPHVMSTVSVFKFLRCDGGVYDKSDYPLLYDAIDATYIVSGTQFRVPDLRDRFVIGAGNDYVTDDSGGAEEVTLTINQIPNHTHDYTQPTFGVDIESVGVPDPTGVGNPPVTFPTSAQGGGQPHSNMPPYRALEWVIIAG